MLEQLLQAAEAGGRMGSVIEIAMLQARALQACGDHGSALTALERALTLAAPEGYVRIFLDDGAPMAALLQKAHASSSMPSYIEKLLAAFTGNQTRRPGDWGTRALSIGTGSLSPGLPSALSQVEPLTERELEVLGLIADGASNREIAERLIITVGTVKRHINNLFGKLGVRSRTQAISAARTLGLREH
jgi:LuxR family maltose regulon positive regulatory protein